MPDARIRCGLYRARAEYHQCCVSAWCVDTLDILQRTYVESEHGHVESNPSATIGSSTADESVEYSNVCCCWNTPWHVAKLARLCFLLIRIIVTTTCLKDEEHVISASWASLST
jgi:hypothetical protein